jgi:hypothetical protein
VTKPYRDLRLRRSNNPPPDGSEKAKEAEAIYASLIKHHSLSTPYHRALAGQITAALMRGDLDRATRAIALLPAPRATVDHSPAVSASDARKKLTDLVLNHVVAYQFEEGQSESAEVAALRAQVASLQDECRHLRGSKPRALPAPTREPMQKAAALEKGTPSSASAPAPAPSATVPGQWDASPEGRAWHAWNNAGGAVSSGLYGPAPGSDGLPAAGWISRLNFREW